LKKHLQDFVNTCTSKKEEQQRLADSYFEALKRNKITSLDDVKSKTNEELYEIFKVGRPLHGMMFLEQLRTEQIKRENRDILIKYSVILQMEKTRPRKIWKPIKYEMFYSLLFYRTSISIAR